ncbi:MAG: aldolase [Leptospirales bacterium]|nr:aldolase [Leptospirales bacterium]
MTPSFASLREQLRELHSAGFLCALKTGTEVEDMSFDEIRLLRAISDQIIPLYVKVGGPEARNDIREMARIGVDAIIAPMIESHYALAKFIETLHDVLGASGYERMQKGVNLETIVGFRNLNEILKSAEARELDQLTAARSDLSGSMGLSADDDRVLELCSIIVAHARENDLRTSVGGGIHTPAVERIIERVRPETVNTRHMVMPCRALLGRVNEGVERNLEFEVKLYQYLASMPSPRQKRHGERARVIASRMQQGQTAPAAGLPISG